MRRVLLIFCAMAVLLSLSLLASLAWLVESRSGLQQLAQWAVSLSDGQLEIDQAEGRLRDRLDIGHLRWHSEKLDIEIRQLSLEWSPQTLFSRHLELSRLDLGDLRVSTPPSEHPEPLPADLQWPFGWTVRLEQGGVGRLQVDGHEVAREIQARYFSDARQHHLESLRWMSGDGAVKVEGHGTLDAHAPFALSGAWQLRGQLEHRPMALMLETQGVLERIQVKAVAKAGVVGQAQAVITPWGAWPYENLHVQLDQVDPASWHRSAPSARLSLTADIQPQAQGVAGEFMLRNHQPGPLDRQLLPIVTLSGHVRWEKKSGDATFKELMAQVSGGGSLSGSALWRDRHLQLDLAARQVDLEQVLHRLRPTRLSGGLTATLGSDQQVFKLALRDERVQHVQLEAQARLQEGHLNIPHLKLIAGDAQLKAQGELHLDAPRQFSVSGQLQRFDPSRFAKVPPARFNADWQATGRLLPHPQVDARFTILDSRIAQQALSGQGDLSLDWPRIPRLNVELNAGSNHLHVAGAYGQPGDRLTMAVDAPNLGELAQLGLEGRLTGQGVLSGDLSAPDLSLKLSAKQLGWQQHFRMEEMNLSLNAGMRPAAPLSLDLTIARLDLPEHPGLLRQFHLQGDGQRAAHRLRVGTNLEMAGRNHLTLATQGGWDAATQAWRGQLVEAALKTEETARNLHLLQPAALVLSAQGWQVDTLRLSSPLLEGRISVEGHADAQQMQVEIHADGAKIGQVKGKLQAGMQGAWGLDKTARWQGALQTDIPDLGWLADWIGDGWSSGGRLQGDVQVAGSPSRPVVSGRLQGSALSLRLPGQGLSLAGGVLDVDLRDNLLKIRRLGFDSPLQPPPRALRLSSDENLNLGVTKPGRLDIVGEMRLDQQAEISDVSSATGAANAWLDVHLDRVGAWQRSDQWILVSGRNRIGWKSGVLDVRGNLTVDAGYWQLARMGVPRLSDDVHVHREGVSPATTSSFRPRIDLDVTADLGPHFLFEGAGLTSGLSGQVRLTAQGRDLPRASGSIQARDGRFEAYGQKLDIERGVLRFNGLLDNPGLDVRAVRKGLAIEPGVQIGGTAQKPVVKLVSEPDLPETEKLAWLVLGHGSEQMGVGDATLLLSAAGNLFGNDAGNVVGQLRKTLGIDEIGIRQGNLGDNGARAPASRIAGGSLGGADAGLTGNGQQIFSIGKRLSSHVLLSYEQAMGKAESLVKLTWSLSQQVSLIGRAGSDNAIDILYTLSLGKPAALRQANMGRVGCSGGVNCAE